MRFNAKTAAAAIALIAFYAAVPAAANNLSFIFNTTAVDTNLGYVAGQDYTFTFVFEPTSTAPDTGFSPGVQFRYKAENLTDPAIWADVSGDGLSGAYTRPDLLDSSPFARLGADSGGSELVVQARSDSGSDIGLTAAGELLKGVYFDGVFDGLSFDVSAVEPNPFVYFADKIGTYDALSTDQGVVEAVDGSAGQTNFTINSVTIIPEPSSLALLGLGGLLVARRRR